VCCDVLLQLAPIPSSFASPGKYSRAFIWLVAEEVRAQLHQALLALGSSSSSNGSGLAVPVQSVGLNANGKTNDGAEQNMHEVAITISCSSTPQASNSSSSERQQLQLPFNPTDLLLLSSAEVSCIDDLKHQGAARGCLP
jgi:hypothetical protein